MTLWVYHGKTASIAPEEWVLLRDSLVALYDNPKFSELTQEALRCAVIDDFPPIDPWYSKLIAREISLETLQWRLVYTGSRTRASNGRDRGPIVIRPFTRPYSVMAKSRDHWRIMRAALAHRFRSDVYDALTDQQLCFAVVDDDADRHGLTEPQAVAMHLSTRSLEWRRQINVGSAAPPDWVP